MMSAVDIGALYNNLDEMGVEVFSCPLSNFEAVAEPSGYLGINSAKIQSEEQEREILIHEEGHFATNTFYQLDSPYTVREHQENVASRYGYKKYYSVEKILLLMEDGYTEVWQLAEQFGVNQKYVREMLEYYTQVCNVDFSIELEKRKRNAEIENDPITEETLEKLSNVHISGEGPSTESEAQNLLDMIEMLENYRKRCV